MFLLKHAPERPLEPLFRNMPRTDIATPRLSVRNYPYTLNFPGTVSDYVDFGDNYSKARTDAFSVFGYFLFRSIPDAAGGNATIIGKFSTATQVGWRVMLTNGIAIDQFGSLELIFGSSGSARIFVGTNAANSAKIGIPYFFAVTYSGNQNASGVTFYLVPVGTPLTAAATKNTPTTNAISGTTTSSVHLRMGITADILRQWNGTIQGIGIANTELSLLELQNYYYNDIYPASAQSLWMIENSAGSGSTVFDKVGAVDGTIAGSVTWGTDTNFKPRTVATARSVASNRTPVS